METPDDPVVTINYEHLSSDLYNVNKPTSRAGDDNNG